MLASRNKDSETEYVSVSPLRGARRSLKFLVLVNNEPILINCDLFRDRFYARAAKQNASIETFPVLTSSLFPSFKFQLLRVYRVDKNNETRWLIIAPLLSYAPFKRMIIIISFETDRSFQISRWRKKRKDLSKSIESLSTFDSRWYI